MRATVVMGLAVLALAGVVGCERAEVNPPPESPTATASVAPQEVSWDRPTARFPIADVTTRHIMVRVVSNTNPAQQALTLTVAMETVIVAVLGVHPPESASDTLLALPEEAVSLVRQGNAAIEVTLAPVTTGEALREDVKLFLVVHPTRPEPAIAPRPGASR